VSPDTIVPDATNVFDYNRFMYVRGRVLNMNDPTGHLSQDEIAEFYGYEGENIDAVRQSMINDGWAEDVVNWLSNPDTMFGDVFTYFDSSGQYSGEAMLALFQASQSWTGAKTYRGGFYGLTGERRGQEVANAQVHSLDDDTPLATELEATYENQYHLLPKKTGSDYRNYYDTANYLDYGNMSTVGGGAGFAGTVYTAATCSTPLSCLIGVGLGTLSLALPQPTTYPVILNTTSPAGNGQSQWHITPPVGYYR